MVKLFVKFQKTNAKFRVLQIFAPSSFFLKKCQQIENGVKLCKIPYLYIIFQNFTKKCTICFTSTLSAEILSNFLVCYGVYICKIQADSYILQMDPLTSFNNELLSYLLLKLFEIDFSSVKKLIFSLRGCNQTTNWVLLSILNVCKHSIHF